MESIVKIKNRQSRFTVIDSLTLEDEKLSWKARGIIAYLMTRPPGWKVRVKDLINRSPDGKTAVQSGLKELISNKYARLVPKFTITDGKRRASGREYQIFESKEAFNDFVNTEKQEGRKPEVVVNVSLSSEGLKSERQVFSPSENPTVGKPDNRETMPYSKEGTLINNDSFNKEGLNNNSSQSSIENLFKKSKESDFALNFVSEREIKVESLIGKILEFPFQPSEKKVEEWLVKYPESYILEQLIKAEFYYTKTAAGVRRAPKVKSFQLTFNNWLKKEYMDKDLEAMSKIFVDAFYLSNGIKYKFDRFDTSDDVKGLKTIKESLSANGSSFPVEDFTALISKLRDFWKDKAIKSIAKNIASIMSEAKNGRQQAENRNQHATVNVNNAESWIKNS